MAQLTVIRTEASNILDRHRGEGRMLKAKADLILARSANSRDNSPEELYQEWQQEWTRWLNRTTAALDYVYEGEDAAREFEREAYRPRRVGAAWPEIFEVQYLGVELGMNVLVSLDERLQYDREPQAQATPAASRADTTTGGPPVVFLVHGHDTGLRETVARFIERTGPPGLEVVILEEQADKGRTVLEKLEAHASGSKYAVVLLTGDDIGGVKGGANQQARARQNVIFEFGWFCGLLGRDNVGVIYAPGVELPSDLSGLVYIPLAEWEKKLVRELRASGLDFSVDRAGV